jgi:enamine deaminase RidA (YjgF/YER057c/UK114 family)
MRYTRRYVESMASATVERSHLNYINQLIPNPKPARTCIQAAKLPGDADVEIECIAAV